MDFFNNLFGKKQDPLLKNAVDLVQHAQINSVGMFIPLLDRFPVLHEADAEHWDFILTIAGVFMAASRLNDMSIGDEYEKNLMEIVAKHLEEWNPGSIQGFEDCKNLYESEYDRLAAIENDSQFVSSDAVGKWIVWNVLGRAPETDEECMLVRTTGTMITHTFFNWWE